VVAARWQRFDLAAVAAALRRALGWATDDEDARTHAKANHGDLAEEGQMTLQTESRFADPDGFYGRLVEAHRELDEAASRRFDAKLILLLANHIGDERVLYEAIELAKGKAAP
jgi:hypothetical protein